MDDLYINPSCCRQCPAAALLAQAEEGTAEKIRMLFWLIEDDIITVEQAADSLKSDLGPAKAMMKRCPLFMEARTDH